MTVLNNNLLLGAAATAATYSIPRSLRFNSSDSAYLSRTPASAGSRTTWTFAGWVKRTTGSRIFSNLNLSSTGFFFDWDDTLKLGEYTSGGITWSIETASVFRDPSAWYAFQVVYDTTQATASSRIKLYVNGIQVTAFQTATYPSQNYAGYWNDSARLHAIGRSGEAGSPYFSGYLADIHFIDGQALTPTSFGQFDTNGVWQPKAYSGTYGTNGFHLPFSDNSAATATTLGKDTSGNSNNWTPNNLSVSTISAFNPGVVGVTYSNSNRTIAATGTSEKTVLTVKSFSSGKWYAEFTRTGVIANSDEVWGLASNNSSFPGNTGTSGIGWTCTRSIFNSWGSGTSVTPSIGTYGNGDRIQLAVDFDSKKVWWGVNDNWGGGSPSAGTGAHFSAWTGAPSWFFAIRLYYNSNQADWNTTNTYTPPTGFTAIPLNDYSVTDSFVDSPTNGTASTGGDAGGVVVGNYATLNPLIPPRPSFSRVISNGNLDTTLTFYAQSASEAAVSDFEVCSGKWYVEFTPTNVGGGVYSLGVGMVRTADIKSLGTHMGSVQYGYGWSSNGFVFNNNVDSGIRYSYVAGDTLMMAVDFDNGKLWFGANGTWINSGNPASGTNAIYTNVSSTQPVAFGLSVYSTSNANYYSVSGSVNFGQRPFAYAAPAGFKSLNTANLPTPTILNGATVFDTKLYTGNGSSQTISGLGFSPDLVWVKGRSGATDHALYDTVRGVQLDIASNLTTAETTQTTGLTAFNSDGFSLGALAKLNTNAATYAGWCWDAGTANVTNTAGSITSTVRANASAGFSVATFTAANSASYTVGHGLGVAPQFTIIKGRVLGGSWFVWHIGLGDNTTDYLSLNGTAAKATQPSMWGSVGRNSTVCGLASQISTYNNDPTVMYNFAPVSGYSSFGSYTGNGSATDGPFVYTGFRPRWVMIKGSSFAGGHWMLFDTARNTYNLSDSQLYANLSNAEISANSAVDFLSNGLKLRADTFSNINGSGSTYIYAAFAENPFSIARAR